MKTSWLLIDYKPSEDVVGVSIKCQLGCPWSHKSVNWTWIEYRSSDGRLRVSFESIGQHSTTDACLIDLIMFFDAILMGRQNGQKLHYLYGNPMAWLSPPPPLVIPVLLHASLGFWFSMSPQNSHWSFSWGGCEFFLEFYIEILAPLNLVTCRLDHYVQFSLLNEDSKLISMKHGKVNFIYL